MSLPCRRTPRPCISSSGSSCCAAQRPHRPCRGPWCRRSSTTICSRAQWPPLCDGCVRRWSTKCSDCRRNWVPIRWASWCPSQLLQRENERFHIIDFPCCCTRRSPSLTVINARGEHNGAAGEHEVGQRQQRPRHLWAAKWTLSLLGSQLNANF